MAEETGAVSAVSATPSPSTSSPSTPAAPSTTPARSPSPGQGGRKDAAPLFAEDSSPTPVEPTGEATKLIFGKYKDIAEAEKGYRDLYAKLTEKGAVAPENYDIETAFKEGGIEPMDRESAKDAYEAFTTQLKEHGFNQKQLNWMTKFGGEWLRQQMMKFGPQIDPDGERSKLAGVWGNNTEARGKEVTRWAVESLPADVLNKPLIATAEGVRFLYQMMQQQRGPVPMQNSPAPKADVTDLNKQVDALMMSPEYREKANPMYRATQEKVDKLLAQMKSAMGS